MSSSRGGSPASLSRTTGPRPTLTQGCAPVTRRIARYRALDEISVNDQDVVIQHLSRRTEPRGTSSTGTITDHATPVKDRA